MKTTQGILQLDCARRVLGATYNPEIGSAVPLSVYLHHELRYRIPALKEGPANDLLRELAPLASAVCDGYRSEWDGSNHRGRFSAEAEAASEQIGRRCEGPFDERDQLCVWQAEEWYATESDAALRERLGITAETSDEQLGDLVASETAAALQHDADAVEGIDHYLTQLRDAQRAL